MSFRPMNFLSNDFSSNFEFAHPEMVHFIVSTKNKRKVVDESNYIYDFHSSNKALGGWSGAHFNIWKSIKTLKEEDSLIQGKRTQIVRGDSPNSCRRYQKITERLKSLVTEYQNFKRSLKKKKKKIFFFLDWFHINFFSVCKIYPTNKSYCF